MELTKDFDDEAFGLALASWTFVDLSGLTPKFASLFGDVFLSSPDGTWWYLDRTAGSLLPEWASAQEMVDELQTEEGQDRYLLATLALAAGREGYELAENEVFDWVDEPAEGGRVDLGNIQVTEFAVAMAVAGQIHAEAQLHAIVGEDAKELLGEDGTALRDLPGAQPEYASDLGKVD